MREGVYSYSCITDELSAGYLLPDEMIDNRNYIRVHLLSQGILFIGTRDGLYALKKGSNTALLISNTQAKIQAKDSLNVKV
jgi:hypothetical protein